MRGGGEDFGQALLLDFCQPGVGDQIQNRTAFGVCIKKYLILVELIDPQAFFIRPFQLDDAFAGIIDSQAESSYVGADPGSGDRRAEGPTWDTR